MKLVLKIRTFSRWMKKTQLNDAMLLKAIQEMENGLVDADLGGNIFKKRIALQGRGKRGSVRTLIATNKGNRWIFLFGFKKNERENIAPVDLAALRAVAHDVLALTRTHFINGINWFG
ncbi:MAG: type II toxin-antitoxin system RelE/ParE family toxin [Burkholderiaceae bacterium]|jgi:hypothetical protein|nr:type II toxin-antitoxin system RelE/ParE family toxin [Burkholderiaceae bacterium]